MEILSRDEVQQLTPPERLALIAQLWDSLETNDVPLLPSHAAELDRRLAVLDREIGDGFTWSTLKAELEQRCR
jgi:putative addiction module component (TIGR02574 family)